MAGANDMLSMTPKTKTTIMMTMSTATISTGIIERIATTVEVKQCRGSLGRGNSKSVEGL